jgi:hypothetical protein
MKNAGNIVLLLLVLLTVSLAFAGARWCRPAPSTGEHFFQKEKPKMAFSMAAGGPVALEGMMFGHGGGPHASKHK